MNAPDTKQDVMSAKTKQSAGLDRITGSPRTIHFSGPLHHEVPEDLFRLRSSTETLRQLVSLTGPATASAASASVDHNRWPMTLRPSRGSHRQTGFKFRGKLCVSTVDSPTFHDGPSSYPSSSKPLDLPIDQDRDVRSTRFLDPTLMWELKTKCYGWHVTRMIQQRLFKKSRSSDGVETC